MNILNKTKVSEDQQIINYLINSEIPTVIRGAGKLAEIYLKRYKFLNIKAVFSDSKTDLGKDICGIKIVDFDYCRHNFTTFNILIAHGYPNLKNKYLSSPFVKNIFHLFDIHEFGMSISDSYYKENEIRFQNVFNALEDDLSKQCYEKYINSRLYNDWKHIEDLTIASDYIPDFLKLNLDEVVLDCGAYDGDSLINYNNKIGSWGKYYAIEPDSENFNNLRKNSLTFKNIEYLKIGVWSDNSILQFEKNDDKSSLIYNGEIKENRENIIITVNKIDNFACDSTFIKMDVEGAEYEALKGAVETIKRNKPKLAISIYHNQSDLFRIFELISEIRKDYTFYFRLHNRLGVDAMLYAI